MGLRIYLNSFSKLSHRNRKHKGNSFQTKIDNQLRIVSKYARLKIQRGRCAEFTAPVAFLDMGIHRDPCSRYPATCHHPVYRSNTATCGIAALAAVEPPHLTIVSPLGFENIKTAWFSYAHYISGDPTVGVALFCLLRQYFLTGFECPSSWQILYWLA